MAAVSAGRVLLIGKGEWESGLPYNKLDWVRHNNSAYACKKDGTVGVEPGADGESNWLLMAKDPEIIFEDEDIDLENWTTGEGGKATDRNYLTRNLHNFYNEKIESTGLTVANGKLCVTYTA